LAITPTVDDFQFPVESQSLIALPPTVTRRRGKKGWASVSERASGSHRPCVTISLPFSAGLYLVVLALILSGVDPGRRKLQMFDQRIWSASTMTCCSNDLFQQFTHVQSGRALSNLPFFLLIATADNASEVSSTARRTLSIQWGR
jgi:hypothetical protein